ncbi:MAG: group III truncated hemoglobin [Chitinophagaceae bacterium]|nr:group III truncated hemoglobin [Chitinophagaceae bacterium]MDP1763467.1 group III truncated hemoglobin [Sediminibacterium sp.]MDP1811905.1 group III truncated hemoglobin [Sediminibacterium sp.]MDP3128470.1 group III truncated hemoglobin [Sediminibacterium sp.]
MKRDIENRADIEVLVDRFYIVVRADDVIGFIFNDIVKINWEKHMGLMCDFWENALFFTGTYSGNPMTLHKHLHHIRPLESKHFNQWILLFTSVVDELFEGEKATLAKQRATSIATILESNIIQYNVDQNEL